MSDHGLRWDGSIPYVRKSCIEDYQWCPYKFKRVWIDKVEIVPNNRMLMGTRFHDFAYKFFRYAGGIPSEDWLQLIPDEFVPQEYEMAEWFVMNEWRRLREINDIDLWQPIMCEQKMVNEQLHLESTVDRVDWYDREKDEVCIIEYKTGEKINWDSLQRQLAFYSLLWSTTIGLGKVTHMKLINPRIQVEEVRPLEEKYIDEVLTYVYDIRKSIENNTYDKKCSPVKFIFCRMCETDEVKW